MAKKRFDRNFNVGETVVLPTAPQTLVEWINVKRGEASPSLDGR